jgi:hypothetical protein
MAGHFVTHEAWTTIDVESLRLKKPIRDCPMPTGGCGCLCGFSLAPGS